MELRHLRYFVAVAQALNFTRAAEKLHTSQPSLSSQIRDLEACVGVPLLVRDKRKVALTAAGECFLQDALVILEQAENAKVRARKTVQEDNHFAIGFVPSAEVNLLPKVLPLFRLKQPDTHIELVSLITTEQEEKILRGELDVGLMRHPVYSPELDYLELIHEPLVVVLPVNHPLANEKAISAQQLHGVNFVSTDPAYSGALAMIVKNWFQQQKSQPNIVQVATNILVTMNLVSMGLGVTLIPGYMNNFNTGQVVFRPIVGDVPTIALLMAWKKGALKPALTDFIATVHERLAVSVVD
ncbi:MULTISPECIES: DNA-binding transcriptional regulator HcaR [Citrobacter]|uniref:DNA-binding transcriptional regulator HcaR n=1 Tax=Citrobacter TaxID=544 RepID=UPI00045633B7|nr:MULTISPECIES: DNA-binding transcriptional regulator HcaR [Citrobacter]AHY14506.1 transcriptional regulator [Citrobacter freundii CFNIH1]KAA0555445.1 DNA-binding transcriptional regulator HcaR [Citrobacter werkmanii]MBD0819894.1 DNA-binding transcriptional regulator HcaR [Citrobacter sp. C5_2]MDX7439423.1 DNA-binding transcriptional regulator HcaR [Citrobacter cronae]NSL35653.1 DNA-binding transcriptional regulator HcaR [Citrobacter werkmanii]